MKKITIFIGSSINECRNERLELTNFIRSVSDGLEESYEVKLVPLVCEESDPCMGLGRKQEEYNEMARTSDMSFFIFFTKAGKYTEEEFNAAYEQFCASAKSADGKGKPKIYIYRKNLPEGVTADASLYDFLKRVDEKYGHYYGTFDHVDTVKLRVLLNVKMQEMQFLGVAVSNGKCKVDGKEVLDLSKVSEFANSGELKRLRAELEETEEKYFRMKPEYASKKSDAAFYREYAAVAARRQELLETIEALEKSIFELSLHLSEDEVRGTITPRMREAYRRLEAGDTEGCLAIVDPDEIIDEFTRWEKKHREEAKRRAYYCIREVEIYIEALTTAYSYSDRFAEIGKSYEKILPIAKNYGMEGEILYDYAAFLYDRRDFDKALKFAEELLARYDEETADGYRKARLYNLLAMLRSALGCRDEAENLFLRAQGILGPLTEENPAAYKDALATNYNDLAVLYSKEGRLSEAEKYYLNALKIAKGAATEDLAEDGLTAATAYSNLAALYGGAMRRYDEAETWASQAVQLLERAEKKRPKAYDRQLFIEYSNLGVLYEKTGRGEQAAECFLRALERCERLAEGLPAAYEPELTMLLQQLASAYEKTGAREEAKRYYLDASQICKRLAAKDREMYEPVLADMYNALAILYDAEGAYRLEESYHSKALEIRKRAAEENPEAQELALAESYHNLAVLFGKEGRHQEAEKEYFRALKIWKRRAADGAAVGEKMAVCFENLASLYAAAGRQNRARKNFLRALRLYDRLTKGDAEKYEPQIAALCCHCNLTKGRSRKLAETCALRAVGIYERLSVGDPKRYELDYAVSCEKIALLDMERARYRRAEAYQSRAVQIYERYARQDAPKFEPKYVNACYIHLMCGIYASICEGKAVSRESRAYARKISLLAEKYSEEDERCKRIREHLCAVFSDFEDDAE